MTKYSAKIIHIFLKCFYSVSILLGSFFLPLSSAAQTVVFESHIPLAIGDNTANWLTPISIPIKHGAFLIAKSNGEIVVLSSPQKHHRFADISSAFDQQEFISLTAIALHPSYGMHEQDGSNKLYTAHLANSEPQKQRARINSKDEALPFDVVITEWQTQGLSTVMIDMSTKREVMRIGVPTKAHVIKQLQFDPYQRTWDSDYGLLHLVLFGDNTYQQNPLFSGVILRINPAKFGMKAFSIPNKNPFKTSTSIHNSLVLIGVTEIESFLWSKKLHNQVVIAHQQQNQTVLSLAKWGENWLEKKTLKALVTIPESSQLSFAYSYAGKLLPKLRNQLIVLSQENDLWRLHSISLDKNTNTTKVTAVDNIANTLDIELNSLLFLAQKSDDELVVFDQTHQDMMILTNTDSSKDAAKSSKVAPPASLIKTTKIEPQTQENNQSQYFYLLIIVLLIIIAFVLFYLLQRNKHNTFPALRSQFARFEVSEDHQSLNLYKRHSKVVDLHLPINSIIESVLLLNNDKIGHISTKPRSGFNENVEDEITRSFLEESRIKMVDEKTRQISLFLTDADKKQYPICLYYRKGNQRLTKAKYSQVLEQVIDWCWFIGAKISSETPVRPVKEVPQEPISKPVKSTKSKTEDIMPIVTSPTKFHTSSTASHIIEKTAVDKPNKQSENSAPDNKIDLALTNQEVAKSDSQIIFALDKLVALKQAGHVTEAEFEHAKAKLLQDLIDH